MIDSYLKKIKETYQRGDAREESYYSALEDLINNFADMKNKKDISVTSQPKKTDAGNPDFRIWAGKHKIVGYIEAKSPDKQLDNFETSEQIKRYKSTFPNFILTNFLEFKLYRNENLIDQVNIAQPLTNRILKRAPTVKNENDFDTLLDKFFSFSTPSITSSKRLAIELAKRTRFLRDEVIAEEIREEEKRGSGNILGFFEAFQKYLIKGLTKEKFADLYSQTITYGLFASKMRCEGEFNRKLAVNDIPKNVGILKEIFEYISLGDLPIQMEWIVDEISNVLANTDVKGSFSEFFKEKKGEDPVFHFYETFLAEYDPEEREQCGVYYTPEPVVSYIVRSIHVLLKEKFGLSDGLANENVTILDPGGGTLTFVAKAIKETLKEFISKYGDGGKTQFIKDHILKDFYSFELMIAPYAIGHLKISFLLEEIGYKLKNNERIKFYITNTLEKEEIEQTALPGMASLAEESKKAGEVKNKIPILVILGNPPYSGISANKGEWITGLIEDYKYVDGEHFGERKHWLQDDYVKFIRFAEWKINQSGKGIIGYITNHSYLDNPTFRGMRQHLMNSFNEIMILDLHGDKRKKEKCPDGSVDDNVFGIRQGVAISFFVKKENTHDKNCKVCYSELWGLQNDKYSWLESHNVAQTKWEKIEQKSPYYFFVPRSEKYKGTYKKFWKITDVFPVYVNGILTAKDKFVIHFDEEVIFDRIEKLRDKKLSDEDIQESLNLKEDYMGGLTKAREKLMLDTQWKKKVTKILYRPFDLRSIIYHPAVIWRPRTEVMKHMKNENIALLVNKRKELYIPYSHFFVTDAISEHCSVSNKTTNYHIPLYLYDNNAKKENINPAFLNKLKKYYSIIPKGDSILYYTYAVFYSNLFRNKYDEFLKSDFPSVPFTKDYDLFIELNKYGKKLIDLHLLKSKELEIPISRFHGSGDNTIKEIRYDEKNSRVFINQTQFFDGIKQDIWDYLIGSYQILYQWLKDRRKKQLTSKEIKHYCKVVTAINKTIKLQEKIDELYPKIEKNLLKYQEKKTVSLKDYLDD